MQEIIGWILCGLGVLCGLRVVAISTRNHVPLSSIAAPCSNRSPGATRISASRLLRRRLTTPSSQ